MVANIGFNPMNNGDIIIITVPPLTEERRRDLSKQAKSEAEDAKIGIRNARKDANRVDQVMIGEVEQSEDQNACHRNHNEQPRSRSLQVFELPAEFVEVPAGGERQLCVEPSEFKFPFFYECSSLNQLTNHQSATDLSINRQIGLSVIQKIKIFGC